MNKLKDEAGLTLIEVMMVVIILGVLVALVVPSFVGRTEQARIAAAKADIQANIAIGLEMYLLDNGNYPTTEQGLRALLVKPDTPPIPSNWQGPYLKKHTSFEDPWGEKYVYVAPGEHNTESYDLYSKGPDRQKGGNDDITNWEDDESAME
ncbi:MAG: type II secretion system protein GspG [Calditrichaeota bacterium]|nr:MAG: type II secretion system protein GspG [Calditrichota bacterium]